MKQIFTFLILLSTIQFAKAQSNDIEEIQRFIISDVRYNKVDVTEKYLSEKAYMVLYRLKGKDEVYLANVWPKTGSQSYGNIFDLKQTSNEATADSYKNETLTFKWSYQNDFDNKQGTATIKLGLVYKPTGIAFLLTMITDALDVTQYKGYVSGSLNLN